MQKHLIVIGGGAAGFFCAVNAAMQSPVLRVTILEKSGKLLSKVRISGGGRCNVTHACFSISDMIRNYPRGQNFLKQAFHHFFTKDTIEWFQQRGVRLKAEEDGRMFPVTDSSETIINCLIREAEKHGVLIRTNSGVKEIRKADEGKEKGQFVVHLSDDTTLRSDYVCVACGGFPKLNQYEWLQNLGHSITSPVPSLFTFNLPGNPITSLMGVSVADAMVKIKGTRFQQTGPLLVTHWGFSGPAVLKLSAYAANTLASLKYDFEILVNWVGNSNENEMLAGLRVVRQEHARKKLKNQAPVNLPQRLWEYHLENAGIDTGINWAELPARQQNLLAKNLCSQEFHVKGKTTFKEEFVTAGGVSLNEISPSTMESRILPGLFFAGEIMDVDGITGGFNFQHAWTSGFIAASAIGEKLAGQSGFGK